MGGEQEQGNREEGGTGLGHTVLDKESVSCRPWSMNSGQKRQTKHDVSEERTEATEYLEIFSSGNSRKQFGSRCQSLTAHSHLLTQSSDF